MKIPYPLSKDVNSRVCVSGIRARVRRAATLVGTVVVAAASVVAFSAAPAYAAPSATTLSVTPPAPQFGQAVTLTATVTCTPAATGTVTFLDGATTLATKTLTGGPPPTATLVVNGLAPGAHAFTAQYGGDANCDASASTPPTAVTVSCQTISGTRTGLLVVTQPTCLAPGTQITGGVTVSAGGALASDGATIIGGLTVVGGTGLRVCGTTISGSLVASAVAGVIFVGETDSTPTCAGNTINGSALFSSNTGFLEIDGNQVLGIVSVTGNTSTLLVPPENATTTEIESNQISGLLLCSGNTPAPTNDSLPNTVAGGRFGQCATL
jgi:hypothetical protein